MKCPGSSTELGHSSVVGQEEGVGGGGETGGGGGRNLCGGGGKCPTSKFINFSNLVRLFNTSNLSKFCN